MEAVRSVLVLEPVPTEIEALIQRRHALGQDRFDEVWEGVYHMTPCPGVAHAVVDDELAAVLRPYVRAAGLVGTSAFNLGEPDDYRVPDRGYHRGRPTGMRVPSAAIVVEILSPGDETYDKFDFYAAHGVEEVFVADPAKRTVGIWRRPSPDVASWSEKGSSALLGVSSADLVTAIDWPDA